MSSLCTIHEAPVNVRVYEGCATAGAICLAAVCLIPDAFLFVEFCNDGADRGVSVVLLGTSESQLVHCENDGNGTPEKQDWSSILVGGLKLFAGSACGALGSGAVDMLFSCGKYAFSTFFDETELPSTTKKVLDATSVGEPFHIIGTNALGKSSEAFVNLAGTKKQQCELQIVSATTWAGWSEYEAGVRAAPENKPALILFTGPPGCGKTAHAREYARYLAVPLISWNPVNAGHLDGHGQSPFARALKKAQDEYGSAVILVDEIDEIQKASPGALAEIRQAVDGAVHLKPKCNITIIATTNKPVESLPEDLVQRAKACIKFGYLSSREDLMDYWRKNSRNLPFEYISPHSPSCCSEGYVRIDDENVCASAAQHFQGILKVEDVGRWSNVPRGCSRREENRKIFYFNREDPTVTARIAGAVCSRVVRDRPDAELRQLAKMSKGVPQRKLQQCADRALREEITRLQAKAKDQGIPIVASMPGLDKYKTCLRSMA